MVGGRKYDHLSINQPRRRYTTNDDDIKLKEEHIKHIICAMNFPSPSKQCSSFYWQSLAYPLIHIGWVYILSILSIWLLLQKLLCYAIFCQKCDQNPINYSKKHVDVSNYLNNLHNYFSKL